jgi:hypothetical protein
MQPILLAVRWFTLPRLPLANGPFVSAQAIQLHGGIGMMEEYPVEHYFERLLVFRALEMRFRTSEFAAAMVH